MNESKQVNKTLQCLATLFLPTGIYAFKRIKKLKHGCLVYIISIISAALSEAIFGYMNVKLILNISIIFSILSYLPPIIFMNKWTREFNSSIAFQRVS